VTNTFGYRKDREIKRLYQIASGDDAGIRT
jgi:hypothetical protein